MRKRLPLSNKKRCVLTCAAAPEKRSGVFSAEGGLPPEDSIVIIITRFKAPTGECFSTHRTSINSTGGPMENPNRTFRWLVVIFPLILGACATGSYGGLKTSREVAQAFENYQVFADHEYYYLNQENSPYAVAAIREDFELTGPLWTKLDPASERSRRIVDRVRNFPPYYAFHTYGATLHGPEGQPVGYWYSGLRLVSVKVDQENKTVSIRTDQPWVGDNLP
jgi:hypothetical protein